MSRTAHKLLSASGGEEAYSIDQSIILDYTDDAHLERTPSSAGNQQKWTQSFWIKVNDYGDGYIGLYGFPGGSAVSWYNGLPYITNDGNLNFLDNYGAGTYGGPYVTFATALKDRSAWYHIVIIFNTTESTSTNRIKVFRNGVQCSAVTNTTYPSLNWQGTINSTVLHTINQSQDSYYGSAQFAEYHFLDGRASLPAEFAETDENTGQWIPKEYENGNYGTNGFYLKFVSGALGTDSSGEGNNLTASNLANSDVLLDTPTNNFPTINSLEPYNTTVSTLTQGNRKILGATYSSGNYGNHFATFKIPESGKWYVEMLGGVQAGLGNRSQLLVNEGHVIPTQGTNMASNANSTGLDLSLYHNTLDMYDGGSDVGTQVTSGLTGSYVILALAIDVDNNKVYGGYDSGSGITWLNSGDPAAGSNGTAHTFTSDSKIGAVTSVSSDNANRSYNVMNFGQSSSFAFSSWTSRGNADGNGIGDFYYSPPSGFKALCSKNLPTPTIKKPTEHFNTKLYTGNGATAQEISLDFNPDLVWIKSRTDTEHHSLVDRVRGDVSLNSNQTIAEYAVANFDWNTNNTVDVPVYATDYSMNTNNVYYVMWHWKAGGSGSANNSGDINATVSANTTAGFSIVSWTGDGSNGNTVAHGLGKEPQAIFYKRRDGTSHWYMVTKEIDGSQDYLALSSTTFAAASESYGDPTSSTISNWTWGANAIIAYVWAEIEGFSKIGSYKGNGSANGPYVYTGFRPAWTMIKRTDVANSWIISDSKLSPINLIDDYLAADLAQAAATTSAVGIDFLSNGFKIRNNANAMNNSSGTYFYMAFAESPFKYANAR